MAGAPREGNLPAAKKPLRVSAFPDSSDVWRIDWFGALDYPLRTRRSNQPSVDVHMSRLVDTAWIDTPPQVLPPEATDHRQRAICQVALGTLVLLRIGDLWRNKRFAGRPDYVVEEFRDVPATGQGMQVVPAGFSLPDSSFLLPAGEHPWHMAATRSYCTRLALRDGRFVVIPALEMARFYFGASSAMLTRMVRPDFDEDLLWSDKSYTNVDGGTADLTLGPEILASSAHDVARLAFDAKSMDRARMLSRSCIRAAQLGEQPVYPQCVFPFTGWTDLKVKGKWLSRSGQPDQTFVVFEILSCSHPFPYRRLTYRVNPESPPVANASPTTSAGQEEESRRRGKGLNLQKGLEEQDPGRPLSGRFVQIPLKDRFPDLRRKRVVFDRPSPPEASGPTESAGQDVRGPSLGTPSGAAPIRSVELGANRTPMPEFLEPVMAVVGRFDGVARLLSDLDEDDWTTHIEKLDFTILTGAIHDNGESTDRRLFVAALSRGDVHAILTVCEADPLAAMLTPASKVAEPSLTVVADAFRSLCTARHQSFGEGWKFDTGYVPLGEVPLERAIIEYFDCLHRRPIMIS